MSTDITLPTVEMVEAIITTSLTDAQIEAIINDAALIAERCLCGLTSARQQAIVKWLTAHLIASMPAGEGAPGGAITSSKLGDAADTYASAVMGDGLKGTSYGQQALLLDPRGCLANLGKRATTFSLLGERSRTFGTS